MRVSLVIAIFMTSTSMVAKAEEAMLLCTLDDAESAQYCKRGALAASTCQLTFAIDDRRKQIRAVNPGRILPEFVVQSWDAGALDAVRAVELTGTGVTQVFETHLDRVTGRLFQSSKFVNTSTAKTLTKEAADAFVAERYKRDGMWGLLDVSTTTGVCKVIQAAIPFTGSSAATTLTEELLEISKATNRNLPLRIDDEKVLDATVVMNDTIIFKYRFTGDETINNPRFRSELFVAAIRKSIQQSTCQGSLEILEQGAKYNYFFVSSRGAKIAEFTLDARQCRQYAKRK